MSKQPIPFHERAKIVAEADELFGGADERDRSGSTSPAFFTELTEEASQMFYSAAIKYRHVGLGLKAREAFARAARCNGELAEELNHFARQYEKSRDEIPVIWDDESEGGEK